MELDESALQSLVDRPSESLAVEIKNWISLDDPQGKSKLVRAALALRNYGGGYLLIGFNDRKLEPEMEGMPPDVRKAYHLDKVQATIGKYASESFEVAVYFGVRDGLEFPVVVVPPGVKSPVAAKSDMTSADGKRLISTDDVYVRTLRSNVPATAKAGWSDWPSLVQVCLDNREADIGRFLRRHLLGGIDGLVGALSEFGYQSQGEIAKKNVLELLDRAEVRMQELSAERGLVLPDLGYWSVAMAIDPPLEGYVADSIFLRRLDVANPQLTGWPVWLVSSGFQQDMTPFVNDESWETFMGSGRHIQYMKYDPKGKFVQRSILIDDVSSNFIAPGKELDFVYPIQDCAEAIFVGLEFAKSLGRGVPEDGKEIPKLNFAFRWSGLKDRAISNWAHRMRPIFFSGHSYQDVVTEKIVVPVDIPKSSIGMALVPVIRKLHSLFNGFAIKDETIEEISLRFLNRQG